MDQPIIIRTRHNITLHPCCPRFRTIAGMPWPVSSSIHGLNWPPTRSRSCGNTYTIRLWKKEGPHALVLNHVQIIWIESIHVALALTAPVALKCTNRSLNLPATFTTLSWYISLLCERHRRLFARKTIPRRINCPLAQHKHIHVNANHWESFSLSLSFLFLRSR
jgi:hypothetical protein